MADGDRPIIQDMSARRPGDELSVLEIASGGQDLATELNEGHTEKNQGNGEQGRKTALLCNVEQRVSKGDYNQRRRRGGADDGKDRCPLQEASSTRKNDTSLQQYWISLQSVDRVSLIDQPVIFQIQDRQEARHGSKQESRRYGLLNDFRIDQESPGAAKAGSPRRPHMYNVGSAPSKPSPDSSSGGGSPSPLAAPSGRKRLTPPVAASPSRPGS